VTSDRPRALEWEAARAGDVAARSVLAGVAEEIARRVLAARGARARDLDDLTQETVLSFLSFLDANPIAPREIVGFLKWRALGILSDHRKRARIRTMPDSQQDWDAQAADLLGPAASARAVEVRAALADCRDRLGADARAVLALRYEGALEADVIAERLGVTRNAVHVRTFRAIAALRECLERKGVDVEDVT